mgnify:CR=1 FL=1
MCLSKAYIEKSDGRELLMDEIAFMEIENGRLLLKTLFGEQKEIRADIKELIFLSHYIILENPREGI